MNQRLRIALDYRPALHARDGIGRYCRELARGLVESPQIASTVLFAAAWKRERVPAALALRPGVSEFRRRVPARLQSPWLRLRRCGVDQWVGGADVFHFTQYHRLPVAAAACVATLHDCIYLAHPEFLPAAIAAKMARNARGLAGVADVVIAPTRFVADDLAQRLGLAAERIAVVPLGCDHASAPGEPAAPSALPHPYVLTISRVELRKNLLGMLAAFERVVAEGLPHHWVIAGAPGWGAEAFEHALERSPARGRVVWKRDLDDAALFAALGQAAAFLFASFAEGFGLPPLEAALRGVPVVAARAGSLPEVLGDAALFGDPQRPDELFEVLRRVLIEPDLAHELGRRGRLRARQFTWERCARETVDVYQRAVALRAAK